MAQGSVLQIAVLLNNQHAPKSDLAHTNECSSKDCSGMQWGQHGKADMGWTTLH